MWHVLSSFFVHTAIQTHLTRIAKTHPDQQFIETFAHIIIPKNTLTNVQRVQQ